MGIIEQAAKRLEQLKQSGVPPASTAPRSAANGAVRDKGSQHALQSSPPGRQHIAPIGAAELRATVDELSAAKTVELSLEHMSRLGYVTPQTTRSQTAAEFRVIKRPLLKNVVDDRAAGGKGRANRIMITSALPGEGKTFFAINLALSMAMEVDHSVVLVDADVSRPSVLKRLQLEPGPGLLDLLLEPELRIEDVLLRTNVERLCLLPPGPPQGRATELLASEQMDRLLDLLANRYPDRILIIDSPPLLPSTEARVLATRMGQVVLVVEAERTQQSEIQDAVAALEGCPTIMSVLNKSTRSEVGSYYGYYGPADK